MPQVRFNINSLEADKSAIMLYFNYDNSRLKMSTGMSIEPRFWNPKTQRVREKMEFPQHALINMELDDLRLLVDKQYNNHLDMGIRLKPEALRKVIQEARKENRYMLDEDVFWNHYDSFVAFKRSSFPDVRDYDKSLRKHLKKAEELFGAPLNFLLFKNRPNGFIDTFDHYLTYQAVNHQGKRGLTVNTIGKQFKNLKVFLNWCFDREIVPPFSLKHMVTRSEEVDAIYLTEQEIDAVCRLELVVEKEIQVRDLFVLGCETALRFSDFSRLEPHHIKKDRIEIHQQKTTDKVIVPICTQRLAEVLKKYNNRPPHFENVTEFNAIIRDICQRAGIDEEIVHLKTHANRRHEVVCKKYELVTSHTCRRSFCTNHYLNGMPVTLIMAISGHKTERAFMRYIKIDKDQKIDLFRENMKGRKSQ